MSIAIAIDVSRLSGRIPFAANKSHQPSGRRWFSGVSFSHPVFPFGEGFTPSPYPLPWGLGGRFAGCQRSLVRIFAHPCALFFALLFRCLLGSIWVRFWHRNSTKNRSKIDPRWVSRGVPKTMTKNVVFQGHFGTMFHRFLIGFQGHLGTHPRHFSKLSCKPTQSATVPYGTSGVG